MVPNTPNVDLIARDDEQLIPEKYPQGDLFVCDVADAVLKDIMPQMEHPFYSLSKKPDVAIRRYENKGNWLEIIPSVKGLATIYDKDILIYCISQVIAKIKAGEEVSKRVQVNSADLLRFVNRGTAGKDYKSLSDALTRLGGTRITTNIRTGDEEQEDQFGLIDGSSIRRKHGLDGRLLWCRVTLSDWVFNAIKSNEVLTLHRDYFRLRKPLERRVYEIARKHCGQQPRWKISLNLLLKKTGSQSSLKKFRFNIKELEKGNHLPDYTVYFDEESDSVTFVNRNTMPLDKDKSWDGYLSADVFEKIGHMGLKEDKYALESDFRTWIARNNIEPKNPDAMFLSFCKKVKAKSVSQNTTWQDAGPADISL